MVLSPKCMMSTATAAVMTQGVLSLPGLSSEALTADGEAGREAPEHGLCVVPTSAGGSPAQSPNHLENRAGCISPII